MLDCYESSPVIGEWEMACGFCFDYVEVLKTLDKAVSDGWSNDGSKDALDTPAKARAAVQKLLNRRFPEASLAQRAAIATLFAEGGLAPGPERDVAVRALRALILEYHKPWPDDLLPDSEFEEETERQRWRRRTAEARERRDAAIEERRAAGEDVEEPEDEDDDLDAYYDAHHRAALQQPPRRAALHRLQAAKEIAKFDPQDFAMETGAWPYTAADLNRLDNSDDASFYAQPRFVAHIDDRAIESLTAFYSDEFAAMGAGEDGLDVLDTCSSWISHLPTDGLRARRRPRHERRGAGKNPQLTETCVRDLNVDPTLPSTRVLRRRLQRVSVDYLVKPQEFFAEVHRVLRPGGRAPASSDRSVFSREFRLKM
ncbi:methyltransferase domain-containing protein [Aureococcus anophagefferens]|nr:methyltransferase domain-containing protein [Aureococcus anophagefferens]